MLDNFQFRKERDEINKKKKIDWILVLILAWGLCMLLFICFVFGVAIIKSHSICSSLNLTGCW